jgi:murein DD-endopeptidase MepM/ murein hydrolase activator NlpD
VLACLLLGSGVSFAASGGGSGGAGVAPPPRVTDARCLATPTRPCIDPHSVARGGKIVVSGRYLTRARTVFFYGRPGRADDVEADARPRGSTELTASVPSKAASGPLAIVSGSGARSRRWTGLLVDEPSTGTKISNPRKIFYGGLQKAVFTYQVSGTRPIDVTVNLVRLADRAVVRRWPQAQVMPGVAATVAWDGTARGKVQPEGYYSFQATTATASGSQAMPGAGEEDSFAFYGNMFPVQGRHDYGGAAGRFGAGRPGHSHQGQDVMAACGTPLVAARAGKVAYKGYHSLAGYYLVVHGDGSGPDYFYAHLRTPALVKNGDRIYTGQPIGEVGDTGNARGCHLHFELWSTPGWYKGGRPFDPLLQLRHWDRVS